MPEFDSTIEYRDIPGYFGYKIGSDGSVWSCRTCGGYYNKANRLTSRWKLKKPHRDRGYVRVCLRRDGKDCYREVHILLLESFVGPRPQGMQACHDPDPDRSNNRLDNLRWDTQSENALDRSRYLRSKYQPRETKICKHCEQGLPRSEFYKDARAIDGLHSTCKNCNNLRRRNPCQL